MMSKLLVSATVTAALCSLAISVAPALGQLSEFESESSSASEAPSTTAQVFRVGSSGWVECLKIKVKASPVFGPQTTLKVKLKSYTSCSYSHGMTSKPITNVPPECPIVLESNVLEEIGVNEFAEGLAKFHCNLKFITAGPCEIVIDETTTGAVPEFAWTNTNTTTGHYESLLKFRLEKLEYTITGTGCGSSGTNGEYVGSVPVEHVIVLPTL
jgi:hypothetical protein